MRTLTLAAGGSLSVLGNITGAWIGNATDTINAGSQNISVNGNLSLSDGIAGHVINLNTTSGNVSIAGSLILSGGANISVGGAAELHIGGDFMYTAGTFAPGTGTVYYEGSASQVIAALNYYNLTLNKSAGTATISGATNIAGTVNLNGGSYIKRKYKRYRKFEYRCNSENKIVYYQSQSLGGSRTIVELLSREAAVYFLPALQTSRYLWPLLITSLSTSRQATPYLPVISIFMAIFPSSPAISTSAHLW